MGKGRSSYARARTSGGTNSWRGTDSMALRTQRSSMPRRRNCFSTISARWGAQSVLSGMRDRRGVLFPGPGFQDFFHLREREAAFVLAIVKMRRQPDPGFRAVIHQDFPREQFATNFVSVRAVHGNRSGALGRIFRRVDSPATRLCTLDEARRHANGFFSDGLHTDLIENVESRPAGKQRGNVRRAVEIAIRILARIDRAGLEGKRAAVRDPAGKRRLQFGPQIFAHVEVSDSRAAAEPFEHAANSEVGVEGTHIHWDGSRSLECVENDVSTDAMGAFDDGFRIDDERTAKKNKRNRDQQSGFVNGGKKFFQVEADGIFGGDDLDARAVSALLMIEVLNRGKFEIDHHDFVARAAEVKARSNHGLGERDVLM